MPSWSAPNSTVNVSVQATSYLGSSVSSVNVSDAHAVKWCLVQDWAHVDCASPQLQVTVVWITTKAAGLLVRDKHVQWGCEGGQWAVCVGAVALCEAESASARQCWHTRDANQTRICTCASGIGCISQPCSLSSIYSVLWVNCFSWHSRSCSSCVALCQQWPSCIAHVALLSCRCRRSPQM